MFIYFCGCFYHYKMTLKSNGLQKRINFILNQHSIKTEFVEGRKNNRIYVSGKARELYLAKGQLEVESMLKENKLIVNNNNYSLTDGRDIVHVVFENNPLFMAKVFFDKLNKGFDDRKKDLYWPEDRSDFYQ